jgi:hypothetical protein
MTSGFAIWREPAASGVKAIPERLEIESGRPVQESVVIGWCPARQRSRIRWPKAGDLVMHGR